MNSPLQRKSSLPRGSWTPFIEAVRAMEPYDLLVWNLSEEKLRTAQSRVHDCNTTDTKWVSNWWAGKLFIVRVQ